MKTGEQGRMNYAAKLRNFAETIELNPDLKWSTYSLGKIYATSAEEMVEAARTIGGKWDKKSDEYGYELRQEGDDTHFAIVIEASHYSVCEKVGEEVVEYRETISDAVRTAVEAGQTEIVTTSTKPVWKCPESLLAVVAGNDEAD